MSEGQGGVFVIPDGMLHGARARQAVARGLALPIAGGVAAFTMAEVAHRCVATGEISRRLMSAGELRTRARDDAALARILERIGTPRAPFADLTFERPCIMGILNVTPDSFSDGGLHADAGAAIEHGLRMARAGADVIDVGGESTRPGAAEVSAEEELERVIPVVEALAAEGCVVSIDTRKAAVMEAAVKAGARIVNDVSALTHDPLAAATVARLKVSVILMHMRGEPATMMRLTEYEDVVIDVFEELEARMEAAQAAGIARENIMVDPGIGFAKQTDDNLRLTRDVAALHGLGVAVLYAASRKRFIGACTGEREARARLGGSLAVAQAALMAGAQMVRVHDVAETAQVARMCVALAEGACADG